MTLGLYLALYHPKFSSCICCGSAITMVSMVHPIGSLNVAHAFCGISIGFFMLFPIASMVFPMGQLVISEAFHIIPHGLYSIFYL